jgi:hypothetical protein
MNKQHEGPSQRFSDPVGRVANPFKERATDDEGAYLLPPEAVGPVFVDRQRSLRLGEKRVSSIEPIIRGYKL